MKKRTKLLAVAVIAALGLVVAYQVIPPSQAARAAADRLKAARTVSLGGGFGQISEAENSLFTLLSSRRGAELLCDVFERGTPEAKAYALCGLHYMAPRRFERYAGEFAAAKLRVQTLGGCIRGEHDSAELVAEVRSNVFENYLPVRKQIEDNRRKYEREKRR
jgi:hypothetical protein